MLYTRPTFSCPAANPKTPIERWDLAFFSADEYKAKYNISDAEYQQVSGGTDSTSSVRR